MFDKKEFDLYFNMPHRVELKADEEGGFFVSIPDLPGCYSQAETIQDAYDMILDAKKAWIETALENGDTISEPTDEKKYSGRLLLRIPPQLHSELAEKANLQGVSLNQYLTYLLTKENEKQPIKLESHYHRVSIIENVDVRVEVPKEETYGQLPNNRAK